MTSLFDFILAPQTVLQSFVVLFVGGMLFYPLTSGTSYLYYNVLRKDRFFKGQERKNERRELKKEWLWTFYNVLGNAVLTAPIHHLVITKKSQIYFDLGDHSWGYFALTVLLVLVITEFAVYWAHRLLHHPVLYKHIHLHHHQFRVPSPFTSMAFHPLDSFAQAVPHHLCAFLFPMHASIYLFFIMFLQVWSTSIHERVSWVRWGFINYAAHHTLHHKFNKYNYGQFFTVCDRIFGSYRAPLGLVYDGAVLEASAPGGAPQQHASANTTASHDAESGAEPKRLPTPTVAR